MNAVASVMGFDLSGNDEDLVLIIGLKSHTAHVGSEMYAGGGRER